jgi:predicted kinase
MVVTPASACVVVIVVGLPGAGKSALAAHLEAVFGLRRVCRDRVRAAMFPRCRYTPTEKRAALRAVLLAVEVNLALGESSVVDGMTLSRERDRAKFAELAARAGAGLLTLWLDVPAALACTRVAADAGNHLAADRDAALVAAVQERFEAPAGAAWIDGSLPLAEVCAAGEAVLRERMAR